MRKERGKLKESSRIDEELLCIKGLAEYLKDKIHCDDFFWTSEPDDPPDFWLTIGSIKYAVEVTSITKNADYFPHCKRLAKDIERQAIERGYLSGSYILDILANPDIPKTDSKDWKEIVEKALMYINQTMNLSCAVKEILKKDFKGVLGIEKHLKNRDYVAVMHTPARWQEDIKRELRELIQGAIKEKRKKLGSFENYPEKILMLYDAYIFPDIMNVRQASNDIEETDWFHSIFWVQGLKKKVKISSMNNVYPRVYLLFTKDKNWLKKIGCT